MLVSVRKREALVWLMAIALAFVLIATGDASAAFLYCPLLLFVALVRFTVHIVNDYQRLVVFRMGRCRGALGPGIVPVIPYIDTALPMDLRERPQEVPHESCITKDNARIDVDFLYYWKIVDPEQAVTRVSDLNSALAGLATGLLRAVIGDITLDQALAEREHINQVLRQNMDEITELWGIEVTTVEIREIVMPPETLDIMTKQMSAERTRRAMVLEAEGYKQSQMLRAEGDAAALDLIQEAARRAGGNAIALRYMEMLGRLGEGPATKYIFPLEFTNMLQPLMASLGALGSAQQGPTGLGGLGQRPSAPMPVQPAAPADSSDSAPVDRETSAASQPGDGPAPAALGVAEAPLAPGGERTERLGAVTLFGVRINRNLADFTVADQSFWRAFVAASGQAPVDQVRLVSVLPGSILMTFQVPDAVAPRLLQFFSAEPDAIRDLGVLEFKALRIDEADMRAVVLDWDSTPPAEGDDCVDVTLGLLRGRELLQNETDEKRNAFAILECRLLAGQQGAALWGATHAIRDEQARTIHALGELLAQTSPGLSFIDLCRPATAVTRLPS